MIVIKDGHKDVGLSTRVRAIMSPSLDENRQSFRDFQRVFKTFNVPEADLDGLVAAGMEVTRLLVNKQTGSYTRNARAIYLQILYI